MKYVFVEYQPLDKSFAVYVGGDDDTEGNYDRLFSFEKINQRETVRKDAMTYAKQIARKIGGEVCGIVYT